LQLVRAKKIDPMVANSIAFQSREIMRVVNAELRIAEMTGTAPSGSLWKADKNHPCFAGWRTENA